mgnify:CR=1 FL=1
MRAHSMTSLDGRSPASWSWGGGEKWKIYPKKKKAQMAPKIFFKKIPSFYPPPPPPSNFFKNLISESIISPHSHRMLENGVLNEFASLAVNRLGQGKKMLSNSLHNLGGGGGQTKEILMKNIVKIRPSSATPPPPPKPMCQGARRVRLKMPPKCPICGRVVPTRV